MIKPPAPLTPATHVSPGTEAAMTQLDAVTTFAIGGVGFTGAPNQGETVTLQIAQQPDALAAFTWLASHGNPVAKLYAHWALRTLAPAVAHVGTPALVNDHTEVTTQGGCVMRQSTVREVITDIERWRAMPAKPE